MKTAGLNQSSLSVVKATFKDYLALTKPRIVAVIVFTALVGMLLAPNFKEFSPSVWLLACLGIGLAAASGAVFNQYFDVEVDKKMRRTAWRPYASAKLKSQQVLRFGVILSLLAVLVLSSIDWLMMLLTMASTVGYGVVYTRYLKYATSQNIVIGGIAGAMPPTLGWMALTYEQLPHAFLLTMIVFLWTPPHSWSLALSRKQEYLKAGIPMLPITHGNRYTQLHILLYCLLLLAACLLPVAVGMFGLPYLFASIVLNAINIVYAVLLMRRYSDSLAEEKFWWSILFLLLLFSAMIADRWLRKSGYLMPLS